MNERIGSRSLFEQILCGGSLSDKLLGSTLNFETILWDSESIPENRIPDFPGRAFAIDSTPDTGFPKKSKLILETEEGLQERGRLLHFFANHELLAIETMALTLLRFPSAPLEFRKGVFKTLQDEQRHMGLYLSRMEEYGVKLGQVPFSYYFWSRMKDMQQPLDFVVRMSLTFEQANLDFALEFAELFEKEIHDPTTATLLRTVHDDEVKHVGHGVKWFKEWNRDQIESEGEWGAYLRQLRYPLNARRAKGSVFFSAESRKSAGFSDDYIEAIRIAGGSRGRVPDYYFFNPECEIENEMHDLTRPLLEKIEDLAPVMLWLAHSEDLVELPRIPSLEFQKQMFQIRGELPEMISASESRSGLPPSYEWIEFLKPWGWGSRAWKIQQTWKKKIRQTPTFPEEKIRQEWFSKSYWKKHSEGLVIQSRLEFETWLEQNRNSDQEWIFKSAFSTSGRGHVVFKPSILDTEVKKLLQKKNLNGVLEPYYPKIADFSVQYEIQSLPEGIRIKRFEPRFFSVDEQLQYQGSFLGAVPSSHELFPAWQIIEQNRELIRKAHAPILKELSESGYVGPLGIDALVCADTVIPVLEVNVRCTMGRVANAIEAHLKKKGIQKFARMVFHSRQELKRKGLSDFIELAAQFPKGSFFPVTPVETAISTWVAVHVEGGIIPEA